MYCISLLAYLSDNGLTYLSFMLFLLLFYRTQRSLPKAGQPHAVIPARGTYRVACSGIVDVAAVLSIMLTADILLGGL